MQEINRAALVKRASELLSDGTADRVLGWKAGEFDYDITPAVFNSSEELEKDFVWGDFCGANFSKYLIKETQKGEGKVLVFLKPCDTYSFNQLLTEHRFDLVSQKGVCLANSSYLREWFALNKVPVYLETALKAVKDGAIVCTKKDGEDIEVKCDSVISCAGYIPAPLTEKGGNVYLVGDCDKVGNLRTVVWEAYETAMRI